MYVAQRNIISLRYTLVYRFPTQSEEFFLVQALLKKSIRVLNGFLPTGGTTMIDNFEHVD